MPFSNHYGYDVETKGQTHYKLFCSLVHTRTSSFGPHGGISTMETLIGPGAVRDVTILRPAFGTSTVNIRTIYDIIVLIYLSDAGN